MSVGEISKEEPQTRTRQPGSSMRLAHIGLGFDTINGPLHNHLSHFKMPRQQLRVPNPLRGTPTIETEIELVHRSYQPTNHSDAFGQARLRLHHGILLFVQPDPPG